MLEKIEKRDILHYSFEGLLNLKEIYVKQCNKYSEVIDLLVENNAEISVVADYLQLIGELKKSLKEIDKTIAKNCEYSTIKIDFDRDYNRKITILEFPVEWSKKKVFAWLEKNDYPTKDENYSVNSMYDCTGLPHTCRIKYKNHTYTKTVFYDL